MQDKSVEDRITEILNETLNTIEQLLEKENQLTGANIKVTMPRIKNGSVHMRTLLATNRQFVKILLMSHDNNLDDFLTHYVNYMTGFAEKEVRHFIESSQDTIEELSQIKKEASNNLSFETKH